MEDISGRYINPYTDYGFKLLFGTEPNKDITLELVNALLQGKEVIKSLTLLPPKELADKDDKHSHMFKVYCEDEKGDKIIIEIQLADQQWFKDRSVYYSSFPIRQQAEKGEWNSNSRLSIPSASLTSCLTRTRTTRSTITMW